MACVKREGGSIAFATVGRPQYGFDIYSLPVPAKAAPPVSVQQSCGIEAQGAEAEPLDGQSGRVNHESSPGALAGLEYGREDHSGSSTELAHTDGQSVNFTGHFVSAAVLRGWLKQAVRGDSQRALDPDMETGVSQPFKRMQIECDNHDLGLVFVSERWGAPSLYGTFVQSATERNPANGGLDKPATQLRKFANHESRKGKGGSRDCGAVPQIDDSSNGGDGPIAVLPNDVSEGVSGGAPGAANNVSGDAPVVALTDGFAMEDRPSMTSDGRFLVFSSTREDSGKMHLSWSAVYRVEQKTGMVVRLTPPGSADFSPAVSPDATLVAAATQPGVGSLHVSDPYTFNVVIFNLKDGASRRQVARNGGWPVFTHDLKAVYFHRKCEDGWWSIFKTQVPSLETAKPDQSNVGELRITPRGMHAVTPAVDPSGKWLAVAIRRPDSKYRHIELLNLVTGRFTPLTKPANPKAHHYGPFFSPDGKRVGYHRSRGGGPRVKAGGGSGEGEHTEEDDWVLVHGKRDRGDGGVNWGSAGCPVHLLSEEKGNLTGRSGEDPTTSTRAPVLKEQKESSPGKTKVTKSAQNFTVPNVEFVRPPYSGTALLRIEGSFPAFSPDGSKVAMVHNMGSEDGEIVVMNSDGSDRRTLVRARAFGLSWGGDKELFYSEGPIFASESTSVRVAKVRVPGGGFPKAAAATDCARERAGADVTVLTSDGTGNNAFPSASPDGGHVVFRSSRSGHKNLYIMSSVEGDRGELFRLTEGAWDDTMPNWSPSGDWIAFSSDRERPGSGGFDIFVVRPDGTWLRKLVDAEGGRANHPAFSPDSARVAFAGDFAWVSAETVVYPRQFQPYEEVYVVDFDGSNQRRMTHNGYEDGTVAWGKKFVGLDAASSEGIELTGQITDSIIL